ncbi:hypothetical protein [Achromobacter xylosoxidans]|nr:hypothetical protein [Achromobacter xylosoxidans]
MALKGVNVAPRRNNVRAALYSKMQNGQAGDEKNPSLKDLAAAG